MQGYGLFMMEQLIHSPDGVLFTRGPGAYKIPAFGDIPDEFNVSLLRGASNPKAVRSTVKCLSFKRPRTYFITDVLAWTLHFNGILGCFR